MEFTGKYFSHTFTAASGFSNASTQWSQHLVEFAMARWRKNEMQSAEFEN